MYVPRRLRVLSWNISGQSALWRSSHLEEVAGMIRGSSADVVALQEVHRGGWRARSADQAQILAEATGMDLAFGASFGRSGFEYGNALMVRGEIVSSHVHPLPGNGEPRSLLHGKVSVNGQRLSVFVAHLAAWGLFRRRSRLRQVESIAARLSEETEPFVVAGDFNAPPTGAELSAFRRLTSVASCIPELVTHRSTRLCLDYIFAHPDLSIIEARVLRSSTSDHFPLLAELELQNGG